jgi:hypothetical protein
MNSEDSPPRGEIVIYSTLDGAVRTEVKLQDETLCAQSSKSPNFLDVIALLSAGI